MQHEAAPGLDRPAGLNLEIPCHLRKADRLFLVENIEMEQHVRKGQLLRSIEHEAHRAIV